MQFLKLALRWLPFRPFRRWPSYLGLTKLSCWLLKPFKTTSIQHQSLISFTIVGCRTPVSIFGRYRLISDAHVRQQQFLTCSWNINELIWKMHEMVHCLVAKTVTNVLSGNSRSSCMVFFFSPALVPHSFSRACFRLSCCINTVIARLVWPASILPTYSLFMLQYMKACEGVFAAGDIAHFPLKMLDWERVTIGHWQISHKHGMFLWVISLKWSNKHSSRFEAKRSRSKCSLILFLL